MLRMVLSQAMTIAAVGTAIGGAAAIAIGRVIQSEVHTPGGVSPAAIAWPALVLIAGMLAASAIPAARAARVNLLQFAEGALTQRWRALVPEQARFLRGARLRAHDMSGALRRGRH